MKSRNHQQFSTITSSFGLTLRNAASLSVLLTRGVATMFYLEGDGFIGTQTYLPQKFSFSSDFSHFILKIVENANILFVSRKKMLKCHNFRGDVPR